MTFDAPPDEASEALEPIDPSRTWINQELELLVSGAVVLSLFQLPEVIEQWWLLREGRLSGALSTFAFLLYYAGTIVTYGLIAAFGAHFLMRGFWVALVGTRSAFPQGIDWDELEIGPTLTDYYRRHTPPLEALSSRVDHLASSTFAFLFVFLFMMLSKSLAVLAAFAVAWGLGQGVEALGGGDATKPIAITFLVAFLLAASLVGIVDRMESSERWRRRIPERLRALAGRVVPLVAGPVSTRLVSPITLTFLTRTSRRKMSVAAIAFTYALIALFVINVMVDRDVLRIDSYIYLPVDAGEESLQPQYYDTLRRGSASRSPTLSSDIVDGPYLRLFLPFDAREDNDRLEALCPDLAPQRSSGFLGKNPPTTPPAERRRILDCIDALYELTLDDRPWVPDWIFARHPDFGGRGLMAYLSAEAFEPGRHLLVIRHRPLPGSEHDPDADPSRDEFFLPFWR